LNLKGVDFKRLITAQQYVRQTQKECEY
jgi:hypothetical protein